MKMIRKICALQRFIGQAIEDGVQVQDHQQRAENSENVRSLFRAWIFLSYDQNKFDQIQRQRGVDDVEADQQTQGCRLSAMAFAAQQGGRDPMAPISSGIRIG